MDKQRHVDYGLSVFLLTKSAQVAYDFAGLMYTNTRRFVA